MAAPSLLSMFTTLRPNGEQLASMPFKGRHCAGGHPVAHRKPAHRSTGSAAMPAKHGGQGPFHAGAGDQNTPACRNCFQGWPAAAAAGHPQPSPADRRQALPSAEPRRRFRGPPPVSLLPPQYESHKESRPSCGLQAPQGSKAEATEPHGVNGHWLGPCRRNFASSTACLAFSADTRVDRPQHELPARRSRMAADLGGGSCSSPQSCFGHAQDGAPLQVQLGPVRRSSHPARRGRRALALSIAGDPKRVRPVRLRQPFLRCYQGKGICLLRIKRPFWLSRPSACLAAGVLRPRDNGGRRLQSGSAPPPHFPLWIACQSARRKKKRGGPPQRFSSNAFLAFGQSRTAGRPG